MKKFFKSNAFRSILSSLICIAGGIFVGWTVLLILAIFSKDIPISDAFTGLFIILGGPFAAGGGDIGFTIGDMLLKSAPLIMTGLSVAVAFKTGLFNIGAPGQYLMGAMGSLITALSIPTNGKNGVFVWLLALIVGMLCGALWGAIPGIFKAFLNVNEVIVCIMTNWIAANIVCWVFDGSKFVNTEGGKSAYILKTSTNGVSNPVLGLDKIFKGSGVNIGFIIAIIVAVIVFIIMNKTTLGYELKACGYNKNAAKYAGMKEKRNIILSMVIAGALAGMGASLYFLSSTIEFNWKAVKMTLPADGFNGIPAALLANSDPIGTIFSATFLRYLDKGGFNLSGYTAFNEYVSSLISALIIYFAGFSRLIMELLAKKKKKEKEKEKEADKERAEKETNKEGGIA